MFEKAYKIALWIGVFFGCLYLPTHYAPFGVAGTAIILTLGVVTVIHDYRHGTMPFQKQRDFLREQGLTLKPSDLKRNTQNKAAADPHAGMKRVKKRDIDK